MARGNRRVWMLLMAVAMLGLVANAGYAAISSNAPDWWANPDPGSTNLRAGWYEWDEAWVDGRGMTPDELAIDFDVHPSFPIWDWSHRAMNPDNIVAYDPTGQNPYYGIRIGPDESDWEIDIILGNRQLHPYKLWYVEFTLDEEVAGQIQRLQDEGRFTTTLFAKKDINEGVGAPSWVQVPVETLREGWDENTWYAEYRIEPQPDMEKITWTFNTDQGQFPLTGNLWMNEMYTGTMCTPEPFSAALLLLGLPLGVLARRRREKED